MWHEPNMLQHNKERIAGVDVAADDVADTMMVMMKMAVVEGDGDKDDDNDDDDDEFNKAELKTRQGHLWQRDLKAKLTYTICMLQR